MKRAASARRALRGATFTLGGERFSVLSFPLDPPTLPDALSRSEREIACLVVSGLSNAEIARARGTSMRTVANQVAAVFRKVAVRSRAELVAKLESR